MIPVWIHLTHRRMEIAVSFVAGVMLGVGLLHMLPHAIEEAVAGSLGSDVGLAVHTVMLWVLLGMLAMFFVERFFCFHHHDVESDDQVEVCHSHDHDYHDLTWGGATMGLTLHSVFAGVALAASVAHGHDELKLAGLGTFLVILLHKPFDSMTIGMLMARGGWPRGWRHLVNGLFSLTIPLGVLLFHAGLSQASGPSTMSSQGANQSSPLLAYALAFSAGIFLCIALSDLLPELQFHHHDRVQLSVALLLGLSLAYVVGQLEGAAHQHAPATADQYELLRVPNWHSLPCLLDRCQPRFRRVGPWHGPTEKEDLPSRIPLSFTPRKQKETGHAWLGLTLHYNSLVKRCLASH
jgi:zinc and cadmium transporter